MIPKGCKPYGAKYCIICRAKCGKPVGHPKFPKSMKKYHICRDCAVKIRQDVEIVPRPTRAANTCEWCSNMLERVSYALHPTCSASCRSKIYNQIRYLKALLEEKVKEGDHMIATMVPERSTV